MNYAMNIVGIAALIFAIGVFVLLPWIAIAASPLFFLGSGGFLFFLRQRNARADNRKLRVLLVDDQPFSLGPLLVALDNANVEFDVVTSGRRMLSEIRKKPFDLIILDRYLPDMNGDDALRSYDADDANKKSRQLNVVFYTSNPNDLEPTAMFENFSIRDVWSKKTPMLEMKRRLQEMIDTQAV